VKNGIDNRSNPTYKQDDVEILQVNIVHGTHLCCINIVSLDVVVLNFTMSILKGTFTAFLHLMATQDQLLKKLHFLIPNYVML
jgi:hypothetical protein